MREVTVGMRFIRQVPFHHVASWRDEFIKKENLDSQADSTNSFPTSERQLGKNEKLGREAKKEKSKDSKNRSWALNS